MHWYIAHIWSFYYNCLAKWLVELSIVYPTKDMLGAAILSFVERLHVRSSEVQNVLRIWENEH